MNREPKILAFAGSTRKDSFNKRLLLLAAEGAREAGLKVTCIDLADYPLPLFDQDLENKDGAPQKAKELKELFLGHQGLLIASPEYNSSISGVLKNTIDWVSRPEPGKVPLHCFVDKTAAIMSASPSHLGGLRGLITLRSILSNIKVLVLPDQVTIPHAPNAFNQDGSLMDDKQQGAILSLGRKLAKVVLKLRAT